MVLWSK
jgi:hypothetical protein